MGSQVAGWLGSLVGYGVLVAQPLKDSHRGAAGALGGATSALGPVAVLVGVAPCRGLFPEAGPTDCQRLQIDVERWIEVYH